MTIPIQQRSRSASNEPSAVRNAQLARIARWQRIALGCAVGGAAVIGLCAATISRPLPSVGPPPAGIAPLMPSAAPPQLSPTTPAPSSSVAPTQPVPMASGSAPAAPATGPGYLTFLSQIDAQRSEMMSSFEAAAASLATGGAPQEFSGPSNRSGSAAQTLAQTAQSLESSFQSQTPPAELSGLASAYGKLLQDETALVAQAAGSIQSGDTRAVQTLTSASQRNIASDASSADQALTAAAAALQMGKPFNIVGDPASGTGASPQSVTTTQAPAANQTLTSGQPATANPTPTLQGELPERSAQPAPAGIESNSTATAP